jgi:hypothetical protein
VEAVFCSIVPDSSSHRILRDFADPGPIENLINQQTTEGSEEQNAVERASMVEPFYDLMALLRDDLLQGAAEFLSIDEGGVSAAGLFGDPSQQRGVHRGDERRLGSRPSGIGRQIGRR